MDVLRDTYDLVLDTSQNFYRSLTSNTTQRTVLRTALVVSTSIILWGVAGVAYLLFYYNHLPEQVTTIPIHLQYGYGSNPYGIASLASRNLKEQQAYDLAVTLAVPRSPANLEHGNFMVALHLLGGAPPQDGAPLLPVLAPEPPHAAYLRGRSVLYSTARPALVPYTDPLVARASRVLFLAWHVLFPARAEQAVLTVPLGEGVRFGARAGGSSGGLPTGLFLELRAGQNLQVYEAAVTLTARLRGLRWLMYRHRIVSFVVLTSAFWLCEVAFMAMAWWAGYTLLGGGAGRDKEEAVLADGSGARYDRGGKAIKDEAVDDGLSDTPRTFPTQGRQPPLRYEPARIKSEDDGAEQEASVELVPARGAEADDEDEDGNSGRGRDSGIGTSYSDAGPSGARPRKRSSFRGRNA